MRARPLSRYLFDCAPALFIVTQTTSLRDRAVRAFAAEPPPRARCPLGPLNPWRQEARFPLLLAARSPHAVDCVVTWTDGSGNVRETRATVRT